MKTYRIVINMKGKEMKKKLLTGLVATFFGVGITNISYAATFSDNFDDPAFTTSHWLDGNPLAPQTWSFVPLNGSDLGYHATVDSLSTNEPAVKIANNAQEYYTSGLHIETLLRIDSHPAAYSTTNKAFVSFSAVEESLYMAGILLDHSGAPAIDLFLSAFVQDGSGYSEPLLDYSPVPIDFDIFYKLVILGDSDQAINVLLYDLNNTLLGSVGSPKVLPNDYGAVAIDGKYATTFNDFSLSGSSVPIPGAVWLLGSGLVGLVGLRKKYRKNQGA